MSHEIHILAAGEDPTVKLVIGVLIGVVWIIGRFMYMKYQQRF